MITLLIIGSSGLVGSRFVELSRKRPFNLITPSHTTLDILNKKKLTATVKKYNPQVIINFCAITNIDEAEKERGNMHGKIWQTNVVGVSHIVEACKAMGVFFIQISTDAIFPGSEENPGPYNEDSVPCTDGKGINWYGYTKLIAETETKKLGKQSAIVRISHPFGNLCSERDLIRKTIHDISDDRKMFTDQLFTPTFIDDLTVALWIIAEKQLSGIFHVGCQELVSRWTFNQYIAKKLKNKKLLTAGSMKDLFVRGRAIRTRLGGFQTSQTQSTLGISFHSWQDALNEIDFTPLRGRV